MWKRGKDAGITVFMSLVLGAMIPLLAGIFYSARVQAEYTRLVVGLDEAVFSLFGQYDKDLLERYDLFFIDGGCGGRTLRPDKLFGRAKEVIAPVLGGGLLSGLLADTSSIGGGLTGYTLATDGGGNAFLAQAVRYMKDTAALQLLERAQALAGLFPEGDDDLTECGSDIDSLMAAAEETQSQVNELIAAQEAAAAEGIEIEEGAGSLPEGFYNPLPDIAKLSAFSVLKVVLKDPGSVSGRTADTEEFLYGGKRSLQTGIGVLEMQETDGGALEHFIYNEYLLAHLGNYLSPESGGGLRYPIEYIIAGKESDAANLESVANRVLLVRFISNYAWLNMQEERMKLLEETAEVIMSLLLNPEGAPALAQVLAAGWALAESLVDMRALYSGKSVAMWKDDETWQVDLRNIGAAITGGIDALTKDVTPGFSYEDHLRAFLLLQKEADGVMRGMEMIEHELNYSGRPELRFDCCIYALSAEAEVKLAGREKAACEKSLSYSEL